MNEQATFPRTGGIHFHDTNVSFWEEIPNGTERETVFRGVQTAFGRLLDHLRSRGFTVEPDRKVDKVIRRWYWIGRKGHLEFHAQTSGRTAEVEFFQSLAFENPNGGRYDFDKFRKLPRFLRLRCAVEMIHLIRAMQGLGYTFGQRSDLHEPLARAVLRKAERREEEGLSPLERFNRSWGADRFERGDDGWPTAREIQSCNRRDRDGALLSNGDVRYFRHHDGRLVRGRVFTNMGNMWAVVHPDGTPITYVSSGELFSTDRPDLLPRRVTRESQVSRVSRELGKARATRDGVLSNVPGKLGEQTAAPLAARVAVLETVLARLSGGERGYYVMSRKERDAKDAHVTFFRPNAAGYVWSLSGAGRFQEGEIKKSPSYYDNEENTIAVPCEAAEKLAGVDGCVPNTEANRRALLRAAGKARGARGQSSIKATRKAATAEAKRVQKARAASTQEAA